MSFTELLFPKFWMARAKATCCDFIRKPDQGTTKLDLARILASGLGFRHPGWDSGIRHPG